MRDGDGPKVRWQQQEQKQWNQPETELDKGLSIGVRQEEGMEDSCPETEGM